MIISGLLYGSFFGTPDYLPWVLAAAVGAAALATVPALLRWRLGRAMLTAVAGVAALGLVGVVVFGLRAPAGGESLGLRPAVSAAGSGLLHGWARMLTVSLPAEATPELLATPVLVTWVAAFTSVTLALRTRSLLGPAAPPAGAFAVGLLFAGAQPASHLRLAAAFLLVIVGLLLVRANTSVTGFPAADSVAGLDGGATPYLPAPAATGSTGAGVPRARTAVTGTAFGVPLVGAVVLASVAGALALPADRGDRFDPRALRPPRMAVHESVTPLAMVKDQLQQTPPRHLFTVRLDGNPAARPVDRLRVAALGMYDGVTWSSADTFLVTGHVLGRAGDLPGARLLTAHVLIEDLAGPFLPTVGAPVRIEGPWVDDRRVGYSSQSGVVITDVPRLRGTGYAVRGAVRAPDAALALAVPSSGPGYAVDLPPGLPPVLHTLASRLAAQATTPYGRLLATEQYLRAMPYNLAAPPGHSYAALARMLAGTSTSAGGGHAEQHAAAFAVLARAMGIPARVAVGYLLHEATGLDTVTTRDVHAWAEVPFAGYGWVAFDPTDPRHLLKTHEPLPPPGSVAAPQTEAPPPPGAGHRNSGPGHHNTGSPAASSPSNVPRASSNGSRGRGLVGSGAGFPVAVVIVSCLLVLAELLVIAAKRRRRRRRQQAGTGADRVLGAWHEATDRLVERGMPPAPCQTAAEVAENTQTALGPAASTLTLLAPLATEALYADDDPNEDAVARAWALTERLPADLYPGRLPLRRVRAWLDPRPLFVTRLAAGRRRTRRANSLRVIR
jgi:transglutaminase-like putative cysteine protease